MSGKLKGKTALVTGASSGLGLADVIEFVKEEAEKIYMVSNNIHNLKEASSVVKEYGDSEIITHKLDVTDEVGWKILSEQISSETGRLDVLVNNAGINKRDSFQECTLEDWNRIIAVNQTGVFLGMKYCLELLKNSDHGSVINLSSITGETGYFAAAYTASKWAVRGMTKSAAVEFGKWKIRVNSVHPGFIKTPLNDSISDLINESNHMTPLGRAGEAEEIAKAVTFLASEDSSYLTGSEIIADGGLTSGGQFKPIAEQFGVY
ncbi:3alpha(or 20beta)-hydroxysteroid dehydrogenase [Lentibacillus persicus]|uniref:3alpha(Or 20beta)-hydroxysteroid dehydrogenase n=1 Tax=Lentibacillus persicus TaxID=640948 RepID=A0A1I2A463_9BACI|nr:SDR family oxidoreductase [Lentibacillus persicus]SFE38721.1 3alpha(or 20beta)-hydroxysteroid dehydrogenase [Lentibacillus persicus]